MPLSYDSPIMATATIDYWYGTHSERLVRVGGSKREWAGVQSRPKPSFPTVTGITSSSEWYFNTLHSYTTGKDEQTNRYYETLGTRYGTTTVSSVRNHSAELNALLLRAEGKLANGHLNTLVTLGEGRETVAYIAQRAGLLLRGLRMIRRGDFVGASKLFKSELSQNASKRLRRNRDMYRNPVDLLSNSWLEYQFGIKPIINDCYGAVEAYHSKMQAGEVVTASARKQIGPYGSWYRAGVIGYVRSPELRSLQQLGLTNPVLAAWELVPLSFIVDWFLPIGSYLSYMDSTLGLSSVTRWTSTKTRDVRFANDPNHTVEWIRENYTRRVSTGLPIAPAVGGNLNTGQLTTVASLLQRTIR